MLGLRHFRGVAIDLWQGDITRFACDAMGNAANTQLAGGGGVDGAIHRAAGPTLLAECQKLNGCPTGSAVATGAGALPARWVIHAVGPVWPSSGRRDAELRAAELLGSAYFASFRLADELNARHLAMPSLSTGAYRFPADDAAVIAVATAKRFFEGERQGALARLSFVLYTPELYQTFQRALYATFPESD